MIGFRRFLSAILTVLLCPFFVAARSEIRITSQSEFDGLAPVLETLILHGEKDICVRFDAGVYFFRDNHLSFSGLEDPALNLSFEGAGSVLVGEGDDCLTLPDGGRFSSRLGREYDPDAALVSLTERRSLDTRSPAGVCLSYPFPTFRRHEYVVWTRAGDMAPEEAGRARLFFSQWYEGGIYPIRRIRRGWIRFSIKDKDPDHTSLYSELRYGRCRARYMVDNEVSDLHPYVVENRVYSQREDSLHFCHASTFLNMEDVRLGTFCISGFFFLGNAASSPLFRLDRVSCRLLKVSDCRFEGIRSDVMDLRDADNVRIEGNEMRSCYRNCITVDSQSEHTVISGNVMEEVGIGYSNYSAILCKGHDFVISGNRIVDFCYNGIGLGLHYLEDAGLGTSGLVTRNELYQTEDFRRNRRMSLTDSGAIYICTQTAGIDIVGNYIHDIGGPHGNSGIFGDDGVSNVRIYNNLVLNIENDYSIDIRRCFSVIRKSGFKVKDPNCGNRLDGNVVDGPVRFFVRHSDPDSFRGKTVHLSPGFDRSEWEKRWLEEKLI